MARSSGLLRFPDPVDEASARLVAGGVVAMAAIHLATGWTLLLVAIAYGFWARVLAGPRFSPLGLVVTRLVRPRLPIAPRPVPGPPKRFAQGIGATVSGLALAAHLAGTGVAASVLVAGLAVAASLEAFAGFCLGCVAFGRLLRAGLLPAGVCEACADLSRRPVAADPA
jgi:hypothetical protein